MDQQIENAVHIYERTQTRNPAVDVAAVRTALRGLTAKANLLAVAGIVRLDVAKWQRDRAEFREFVSVGIDLLSSVERGEIDASEVGERFAAALGLLEEPRRDKAIYLNPAPFGRPAP